MAFTKHALNFLQALKKLRVAEKLDGQRLGGGVLISCGDCDRVHELLDWHRQLMRDAGKEPRLHLIMVNGGPLNFVWRWPWWAFWWWPYLPIFAVIRWFLVGQIRGAITLKQLDRIIVFAHWPCGQAGLWAMPFDRAFELNMRAERFLARKFRKCIVVVRLHADKGEVKNTYHICPRAWVDRREEVIQLAAASE